MEAWSLVERLNRTWVEGHADRLGPFFDPDIVIVQPGFQGRSVGRGAAVQSYIDFCSQAKILDFRELEPDIDVNGDVAIVSYTFDISYEVEGRRLREQGRDLFVLRRENRRWRAIWRTLLPDIS